MASPLNSCVGGAGVLVTSSGLQSFQPDSKAVVGEWIAAKVKDCALYVLKDSCCYISSRNFGILAKMSALRSVSLSGCNF